jgi:hypothetical protein
MSMRLGLKSFTVTPYGHEKKVNTPHAHSSSLHRSTRQKMMAGGITKTAAATVGSTLWALPFHPLVTFSLQLSVIAELGRRTTERGEPGLDNAGQG